MKTHAKNLRSAQQKQSSDSRYARRQATGSTAKRLALNWSSVAYPLAVLLLFVLLGLSLILPIVSIPFLAGYRAEFYGSESIMTCLVLLGASTFFGTAGSSDLQGRPMEPPFGLIAIPAFLFSLGGISRCLLS
jgi:hypothetical protein